MKLLEKVFGVTGLKVFGFGLLVGVLLLNGWRLSTILLEGRFTGLQLALFVGLPFVLMVVNAYFLVFRFHPAMIYYRLGFVACLLFVRFCLDYSYIYTLDPMAGDPEEVPSFERAAYALAVG
jgi:hypothetical protein